MELLLRLFLLLGSRICMLDNGLRLSTGARTAGTENSTQLNNSAFNLSVQIEDQLVKYACKGHSGEGSSGTVVPCRSTTVSTAPREIALKMYHAGEEKDCDIESYAYDLLHAQRADFVPEIYEARCHARRPYIAMELLGEPLSWPYTPQDTPDNIAEVGMKVLSMIVSMHERGVIHRDIKPQNLMWGRQDKEKLYVVDFGFALVPGTNASEARLPAGSPFYITTRAYEVVDKRFWQRSSYVASARDDFASFLWMLLWAMTTMVKNQEPFLRSYKWNTDETDFTFEDKYASVKTEITCSDCLTLGKKDKKQEYLKWWSIRLKEFKKDLARSGVRTFENYAQLYIRKSFRRAFVEHLFPLFEHLRLVERPNVAFLMDHVTKLTPVTDQIAKPPEATGFRSSTKQHVKDLFGL
eukprot:TRINITY_DN18725_c0_g1_i1.p1 TRINITY_DN18725_c0_g1~~TRINITY_DN18725_c0_g1_i1.p1  ORF type:complete len:410 (-),score=34.45 TRINITY_DN18725_c0_g1_i1:191-1420(-)